MQESVVVAIDGPAGAGKSSVARGVARRLGAVYIDSGAMYRCVALLALREAADLGEAADLSDAARLQQIAEHARIEFCAADHRVILNGEDVSDAIREAAVSNAASQVAAVPGVRRALVVEQRRIAQGQSVVMEGRDIGTVVFPDAQVKIYLDAQPEVRVDRRANELEAKGRAADRDALARDLAERDHRDRTRSDSPLKQADDAAYVDSSGLTLTQVEDAILAVIQSRVSNGKGARN